MSASSEGVTEDHGQPELGEKLEFATLSLNKAESAPESTGNEATRGPATDEVTHRIWREQEIDELIKKLGVLDEKKEEEQKSDLSMK